MELKKAQTLVGVEADGEWGPTTARAIASKLSSKPDLLRVKLSKNFELQELLVSRTASRRGIKNVPDGNQLLSLARLAIYILQPVRDHFGKPVVSTSGLRVPALNRAVGGSRTSQHVKGEAVDFTVSGLSNKVVARWLAANLKFDQLIYEFGESGWLHCSYGPRHRRQLLSAVKRRSMGRMRTKYVSGIVT